MRHPQEFKHHRARQTEVEVGGTATATFDPDATESAIAYDATATGADRTIDTSQLVGWSFTPSTTSTSTLHTTTTSDPPVAPSQQGKDADLNPTREQVKSVPWPIVIPIVAVSAIIIIGVLIAVVRRRKRTKRKALRSFIAGRAPSEKPGPSGGVGRVLETRWRGKRLTWDVIGSTDDLSRAAQNNGSIANQSQPRTPMSADSTSPFAQRPVAYGEVGRQTTVSPTSFAFSQYRDLSYPPSAALSPAPVLPAVPPMAAASSFLSLDRASPEPRFVSSFSANTSTSRPPPVGSGDQPQTQTHLSPSRSAVSNATDDADPFSQTISSSPSNDSLQTVRPPNVEMAPPINYDMYRSASLSPTSADSFCETVETFVTAKPWLQESDAGHFSNFSHENGTIEEEDEGEDDNGSYTQHRYSIGGNNLFRQTSSRDTTHTSHISHTSLLPRMGRPQSDTSNILPPPSPTVGTQNLPGPLPMASVQEYPSETESSSTTNREVYRNNATPFRMSRADMEFGAKRTSMLAAGSGWNGNGDKLALHSLITALDAGFHDMQESPVSQYASERDSVQRS